VERNADTHKPLCPILSMHHQLNQKWCETRPLVWEWKTSVRIAIVSLNQIPNRSLTTNIRQLQPQKLRTTAFQQTPNPHSQLTRKKKIQKEILVWTDGDSFWRGIAWGQHLIQENVRTVTLTHFCENRITSSLPREWAKHLRLCTTRRLQHQNPKSKKQGSGFQKSKNPKPIQRAWSGWCRSRRGQ